MKWLLVIAIIILLLPLLGCARALLIDQRSGVHFVVYANDVPIEKLDYIENAIKMVRHMTKPEIVFHILEPDSVHLGKTWMGGSAAAHLCYIGVGRVCMSANYICYRTIFHEVGHLYHSRRNRESRRFHLDWVALAGPVYIQDTKLPNTDGILTNYSRGNPGEDIAEWVAECYAYLAEGVNSCITGNLAVKTDPRYRQKLALLHLHGFFTDADYEKLKPLFQ